MMPTLSSPMPNIDLDNHRAWVIETSTRYCMNVWFQKSAEYGRFPNPKAGNAMLIDTIMPQVIKSLSELIKEDTDADVSAKQAAFVSALTMEANNARHDFLRDHPLADQARKKDSDEHTQALTPDQFSTIVLEHFNIEENKDVFDPLAKSKAEMVFCNAALFRLSLQTSMPTPKVYLIFSPFLTANLLISLV